MAVPKKKVSIARKKRRHSHWRNNKIKKLENKANLAKCSNCGKNKLSHRVCPFCWYYADKQVLTIKEKSKEQIIES